MVGVGEGIVHDLPSLLVSKLLFVKQDSQKLDCADCWVSVVQLDLVQGWKLRPIVVVFLLVSSNDVS